MWTSYLLAAAVAYVVSLLDLWSASYPRTLRFVVRCRSAHAIALVYAAIACLLLFLFDMLVAPNIQVANPAAQPAAARFVVMLSQQPLLKAAFVGAFANGLANLKLFNIPGANGAVPIGLQTFMLMLEPMKEGLVIEHHNALRAFCTRLLRRLGKGDAELAALKQMALDGVPAGYAPDRKAAIKVEFDEATHAIDLVQKAATRLGADWVEQTFV